MNSHFLVFLVVFKNIKKICLLAVFVPTKTYKGKWKNFIFIAFVVEKKYVLSVTIF